MIDFLQAQKNINIASYSTNCVGIVVWTVDMIILMSYKKKDEKINAADLFNATVPCKLDRNQPNNYFVCPTFF